MKKSLRETLANGRFTHVPFARSRNMRAVKSTGNKSTELKFCHALAESNITGWEAQKKMLANPDVVFPLYKVAIFLDGCFWHGCPQCGRIPNTNYFYWENKIISNIQRDLKKTRILQNFGYLVLRFWEHELNSDLNQCLEITKEAIEEHLILLSSNEI